MTGRYIYRFALLIVGVWALMAVAGNSLVPPLEQVVADKDQPFLTKGTAAAVAVQRSAAAFSQAPTDNVGYLILERIGALEERDRAFYNQVVSALRADNTHVLQVTDWWQVPVTAQAAMSDDRHVVTAPLRLGGMVGSTEAVDSINAARGIVAQLHPPDNLHVYITGPGATVMDEFDAIDQQTQVITATTFVVLFVLLLIVYRSLITAMVPLVSVMMALAVAKPVVSALAAREIISASLFSVSVSVAVAVGAGTGFAIFLTGRYHELRRQDVNPATAVAGALRAVAPPIVGSILIVAAPLGALTWLSLSQVTLFATTGFLCAIEVLFVGMSALTLTPAMIALASRAGLIEPLPRNSLRRRWRRIGTQVARWPAPILFASGIVVLILIMGLPGVPIMWDENEATSFNSESRRGYQIVDQHFPPNQLLPDVITIEADHDIRNPAGLTAIEQVTSAIMAISGVRMVQSASHPGGMTSKQDASTAIGGNVGDRLDEFADQIASRGDTLPKLDAATNELVTGLDLIQSGSLSGSYAIGRVSLAIHLTGEAVIKVRANAADLFDIFAPLRKFVSVMTDCSKTPVCTATQEAVKWSDAIVNGSIKLAETAGRLANEIADAAARTGPSGLPNALSSHSEQIDQMRASAATLKELLNNPRPVTAPELPTYLRSLVSISPGATGVNLYASRKILTDPSMRPALDEFFSPNGHATRLYVYGNGHEWGDEGAVRARAISAAVADATKDGALKSTGIQLTGVGPATRDLQDIFGEHILIKVLLTLGVILLISTVLLRSPVAGLIVLSTIATSYMCALGASVLIWHHLLHHDLHWSVPPIAFMSMLGVASGGNLLFARRIRENVSAGMRTSIIRAFAATGGVVAAGGIVVGVTMIALALSKVLSVAQLGVTVGIGLLLDALVVRAFVLPTMMVVLDRWLWWPRQSASDEEELEPVTV